MNKIREILSSIRPEEDFERSESFVEDGLLDSFDVVTLVSDLDRTFQISIEGVHIVPENFRTIDTIARLLKQYGVSL